MKTKFTLAALALPVAFGAAVAFHPGVAFAETPLAKGLAKSLQAGSYSVDPYHTSVGFDIEHLGLSRVQGRFTKVSGKLNVDPQSVGASSVTFTIGADSIDTAVAPRDTHLKSKDFFEVETYPEIKFVSTKIEKKGKGYVATGDLTMHGTTKSIKIPFKAYGPAEVGEQMGGVRVGIVSEPFKLNRKEFGIPYDQKLPNGKPAVGYDVNVRLSLEATKDK